MKQRVVRHDHGFTLLEVLLTAVLLVFGIVPMIQAMASASTDDRAVEYRTIALVLAQQKMETIKDTDYASIVNQSIQRVSTNSESDFYRYFRTVDVTGTPKQVTVNVTRAFKDQTILVSLTTLITDI